MKALVIGANGQDGRIISNQLAHRGFEVIGVTRSSTESIPNGVTKIKLDMSDNSNCQLILNRYKPLFIYHLAAVHGSALRQESVIAQSKNEMYRCHVGITRNVLSWLRNHEKSKFHVALSSQIFSPEKKITVINEESKPNPQNFYGETKLEAWHLVKEHRANFSSNANCSILFNHSSEYSSKQFLFPTMVSRLIQSNFAGLAELELKDPKGLLDISDAYEICSAMIDILHHKPDEDFVLGQGQLIEISELVNQVIQRFNTSFHHRDLDMGFSEKISTPILVSDISKANSLLNWKPKITPVDLLERMIKIELRRN